MQDSGVPTGIYDLGGSNLLSTELTSIESQIQHVMMMLSNPQLTPQLRMQFQMQLPQLTVQLNTLRQMSLYGDPYMNTGAMSIAMGGQSGQGGYNSISPDIVGYGGQGYSSGHVFNNPGLLNGTVIHSRLYLDLGAVPDYLHLRCRLPLSEGST